MPVIGFNGSNFDSSPQVLKATLESLGAKQVIFYPDGGAVLNPNLPARYLAAAEMIQSWGIEVSFAWWEQNEKSAGDIDEIPTETLAAIACLSLEQFREKCPPAKPNAFQKWLGNAIDRLTSRKASAPPKILAETIEGDRIQSWLEPGDFDVLDRSFMGSGKSFTVPQIPALDEGRVWYLAQDHRNPSNIHIAGKFTDLAPRSDHLWKIDETGRKVKAPLDDPDGFKEGYCPSAALGYDPNNGADGTENPICRSCPHARVCRFSEGWYRHDRRETLSHTYIRASVESFPRDYDPAKDIACHDPTSVVIPPSKYMPWHCHHLTALAQFADSGIGSGNLRNLGNKGVSDGSTI